MGNQIGDGRFEFLGQDVTVLEGRALRDDGILAGSVLTMDMAVKNMISFTNLPLTRVLPRATSQPAGVIGLRQKRADLHGATNADILLMDDEIRCRMTIIAGQVVFDTRSDTTGVSP